MIRDRIHLLLIEDNASDADLVRLWLSRNQDVQFELHWHCNMSAALASGDCEKCDVALLDLHLNEGSGLELLQRLRGACPLLPVVTLTRTAELKGGLSLLGHGAQDYLEKHLLEGRLLGRTLLFAATRGRLESELRDSERRFRRWFDNNLSGLFRCGGDGLVREANAKFAELLGYSSVPELLSAGARVDTLSSPSGVEPFPLQLTHRMGHVVSTKARIGELADGCRVGSVLPVAPAPKKSA